MIEYITGYRIANEIRMTYRYKPGKPYLIVEGVSDLRLFSKFVDSKCEIKPAQDKSNVIYAIEELNKTKTKGALGIVDNDYWDILNISNNIENLFTTDAHDIETMIISSIALDNFLTEYADDRKVQAVVKMRKKCLRGILLNDAAIIGYLRLLSIESGLNFDFKELPYNEFINTSTMVLDTKKLIEIILNSSHNKKFTANEITNMLNEKMTKNTYNLWHLCCGHDITEILALYLRDIFGLPIAKHIHSGIIEISLRLAYQYIDFINTILFASIKEWEERNTPYSIIEGPQLVEAI